MGQNDQTKTRQKTGNEDEKSQRTKTRKKTMDTETKPKIWDERNERNSSNDMECPKVPDPDGRKRKDTACPEDNRGAQMGHNTTVRDYLEGRRGLVV